MALALLCGAVFSMSMAAVMGQGLGGIVPQPVSNTLTLSQPFGISSGRPVTPLVNLPIQGQIQNQVPTYRAAPQTGAFGLGQQVQHFQTVQQVPQQQPQQMFAPQVLQNQQFIRSPHAGLAVAPLAGGPLANLAAASSMANIMRPQQRGNAMNPLSLMALRGNSDALFPFMMLSQTGMLNQNPMLSYMLMQNF